VKTTAADKGLRVNIGIRPEDFVETEGEDFVYEGKVDFIEALGEVTLLYFQPEHDRQVLAFNVLPDRIRSIAALPMSRGGAHSEMCPLRRYLYRVSVTDKNLTAPTFAIM
jgi:ABC-type sugar transport system ATPase subunit